MTESKNLIIPDFKQRKLLVPDLESDLKNDISPRENSKNSIIHISTYSYGSNGKRWFYLSKLSKKQ